MTNNLIAESLALLVAAANSRAERAEPEVARVWQQVALTLSQVAATVTTIYRQTADTTCSSCGCQLTGRVMTSQESGERFCGINCVAERFK